MLVPTDEALCDFEMHFSVKYVVTHTFGFIYKSIRGTKILVCSFLDKFFKFTYAELALN